MPLRPGAARCPAVTRTGENVHRRNASAPCRLPQPKGNGGVASDWIPRVLEGQRGERRKGETTLSRACRAGRWSPAMRSLQAGGTVMGMVDTYGWEGRESRAVPIPGRRSRLSGQGGYRSAARLFSPPLQRQTAAAEGQVMPVCPPCTAVAGTTDRNRPRRREVSLHRGSSSSGMTVVVVEAPRWQWAVSRFGGRKASAPGRWASDLVLDHRWATFRGGCCRRQMPKPRWETKI